MPHRDRRQRHRAKRMAMGREFRWEAANKRDALRTRPMGSVETAWWWSDPRFTSRCVHCGNSIPPGQRAGYNHAEKAWLCACCVEVLGITPELSRRARAAEREETRKTKAVATKKAKQRGNRKVGNGTRSARGSSGPPAALLDEAWRRGPGWCVARRPGKAWRLVRANRIGGDK